ncbi:amino acid adenylation domain-containing protein [Micromonospora sp. NBC_01796]|uniref:amino acid adenylation domain-containing protein n=1 Tax=Micromonospora sp. NBC_01796 TaxID=2975987 RepID=UPI002DDABD31|nr:amino acid adenylation domain-containing protein [Micromonospora sp. NBC_01796]WSA85604.1 amino acid adenylation domain-containing protein [Micromonospora sp. NBC_01796]
MPSTADPDAGTSTAPASRTNLESVVALSPQRQALLARRLAQRGLAAVTEPVIARLPRTGPDQLFTCSSGQQRMWLASQFDPSDPSFHVSMSQRFGGRLDVAALRLALTDLVDRHEVLRTVYLGADGAPRQLVRPPEPVPLPEVDLRDLPVADREPQARLLARHAFAEPFDLATGPVLRATLYRLADDDHVLMMTSHHIAIDGWSIGNALRELAALYTWRRSTPESGPGTSPPAGPPLPALPIQYADYAHWQHDSLNEGELADGLEFWRRQLAAPRTDPELPIARRRDQPGDGAGAGTGGKVSLSIGPELLDGLRAAAGATRGTTPFVTLLTALKALLARYLGQSDVTVGTLVAARTHVELEPLIGYFANPLALRTRLDPELTFAEAVARVRRTVIDGFAYQSVPFDLVVQELAPRRDAQRHPFFQAALILHNFSEGSRPDWPGLDVRWWDSELDDMLFDLTLVAVPQPDGGLEATFSYRTEVFDAADVERLAAGFRQLLVGIAADPGQRLGDVALLTPADRQRALVDWQGPIRELPPEASTFPALWARSCARYPEAVAVAAEDGVLSYRELDRRANQLAYRLRAGGVGPETPVGICLDRTSDLLVAVLGVWRAGGAYVPLDPAFPAGRLRMMVDDAAVRVLVTEQGVADRMGELCDAVPELVRLDRDRAELDGLPDDPPAADPHPDQLAYTIFTSGSTGRPKGVEVSHGAVGNLLLSFGESLALTPADRLLAVTTLSFDISVLELLLPLVSGARVVVATNAEVVDGAALLARARSSGATVLQGTPATWRMLLAAGELPTSVRHRLCGGEAFSRDLAERLAGGILWNVYGPTETTVWSAAGVVDPEPSAGSAPVTIGPPIVNTRIYLLDGRGQPVPIGVTGEVHIGGAGVARGYRGRPGLTAQRFLPDPFGSEPGGRLYATGDLARHLPDGRIEFLGRGDQQVKIRGFRVELGEIEVVLREQENVRDAAVAAWTDGGDGDARLVAYVVPEAATDAAQLWSLLQPRLVLRLPAYLIPATLVVLDALPLTPNGKLDRAALPAPTWGATDSTPYVAARTPVEAAIVGIWEEVLGVEPIGVDTDFFALGGHSLLAERVLSRLRAYFQLAAPTRVLFDAPTAAGLAAALIELEPVPGQVTAIAEVRAEIEAMSPEDVALLLGDGGAG